MVGPSCCSCRSLFLGWLLLLSWPVISPSGRLLRLLAVLVLIGAMVFRVQGLF